MSQSGERTFTNYTRMLRVKLNKSWRQHFTKQQLYGHLPPITKTIKVRRTRHAGHCWRSMGELISDVLLWIPSHGRAKAGRLARTYIQQLCEDTGCSPEDLPEVMNYREEWREHQSIIPKFDLHFKKYILYYDIGKNLSAIGFFLRNKQIIRTSNTSNSTYWM